MHRLGLLLAVLLLPAFVSAQDVHPALAPYARLVGQWEGPATATNPGGRMEMTQTEEVRVELGGNLVVVEGTGRDAEGEVVFNAFGVFSVDGATGEVWFDAFTQEGRHTRVQPTATDDGFEWSLQPEAGPMIHYTMRFDDEGRWVETGRVSMDGGTNWIDFFEMTLDPVEE